MSSDPYLPKSHFSEVPTFNYYCCCSLGHYLNTFPENILSFLINQFETLSAKFSIYVRVLSAHIRPPVWEGESSVLTYNLHMVIFIFF